MAKRETSYGSLTVIGLAAVVVAALVGLSGGDVLWAVAFGALGLSMAVWAYLKRRSAKGEPPIRIKE